MIDAAFIWVCAHPLQTVGLMAAIAIACGLLLVPRIHELAEHGHPRV
jgi:ElaB/YqjD/DUF883 family membrane-anchored ribosome-binding protein